MKEKLTQKDVEKIQQEIDHLMIHHIVIAMIHAAPIGALAQRGHHAVFIGAGRHHVQRPA